MGSCRAGMQFRSAATATPALISSKVHAGRACRARNQRKPLALSIQFTIDGGYYGLRSRCTALSARSSASDHPAACAVLASLTAARRNLLPAATAARRDQGLAFHPRRGLSRLKDFQADE